MKIFENEKVIAFLRFFSQQQIVGFTLTRSLRTEMLLETGSSSNDRLISRESTAHLDYTLSTLLLQGHMHRGG